MQFALLSQQSALTWALRLWTFALVVWFIFWFGMKRAKKRERWDQRLQHALLAALGFWLMFGGLKNWNLLNLQLLPNVWMAWWMGLTLTAFGIAIMISARATLGRNWSAMVTLKDDHELVRHGLYRWIRHPIYTGILTGMAGTAIILGHVRGLVGVLITFGAFYWKARREERFLQEEFGARFDEHLQQTGMFLPKWT
jgi:protein-S-isoprenylcysteine O-methyltransferase Ste14